MKLEVMLSVMNLKKEDLDKMHITSKCTVINQCEINDFEKYENFDIYSYNELGNSNSRNRGLEHITEDIILLCDDDAVYDDNYENVILSEFKNNPKADVIIFNMYSPNRKKRVIKKRKRLHIWNSLNYASYNIAFRRKSIIDKNIKFNTNFGPNAKYSNGTDTMFIVDFYRNKLRVYSCPENLGVVYNKSSTWFNGYDEKYFFNKGALFTAVNMRFRHILILQYLLRHKDVLVNIDFCKAFKIMLKGSKDYINTMKLNNQ